MIYERQGDNDYIGTFEVGSSGGIDATEDTDGIDVTNVDLGPAFPKGLFVVHDSENAGGSVSNYKLVLCESIADAFGLTIDTSWDPRAPSADFNRDGVVNLLDLTMLLEEMLD